MSVMKSGWMGLQRWLSLGLSKVYHVELGLDLVAVQMGEQVVVGYLGEVGVLEIIQEERIALLDGLVG